VELQQKKDKQDYPSEILQQFPNLRVTKSTGKNENIKYVYKTSLEKKCIGTKTNLFIHKN